MSPARYRRHAYPDLATWRRAHAFNQREAAQTLGISQTYYSRLERGVQAARGKIAKRILETANVPLEKLVGLA
jgi:transcriptional regulator with XRE-family HTH domain